MKVTVFTPTYNRAYIIAGLYASLMRQSCKDFEWLVVDDGSSDNTSELFKNWQRQNQEFPIRYVYKENGGKCSAINVGLEHARGELFFTVDSDDYLTDDAIEKIIQWEKELPANEKYCGLAGNLGTTECTTPNTVFETGFYDGSLLDRYGIVDGERAIVFYTEIHRKYPYPIFEEEKFMTEAVSWNRMAADGYKMRFFNDIIWVYEYKDDGLTKAGNRLFVNNPRGYGLWVREKVKFQKNSLKTRLKVYYAYICDLSEKYSMTEIANYIDVPVVLIVLFYGLKKLKKKR